MKIKNFIIFLTGIVLQNNYFFAYSYEPRLLYGKVDIRDNLCFGKIMGKSRLINLYNLVGYGTYHSESGIFVFTTITLSNKYDPNHKEDEPVWERIVSTYLPIEFFQNNKDKSFLKENEKKIQQQLVGTNGLFYVELKLGKSFNNLKVDYQKFISKNHCNIL